MNKYIVVVLEEMSFVNEPKQESNWLEWVKALIIAVLLAFFLRSFVFATSVVEGDSMYPALEDGQKIVFNKFVYLLSAPKRGDIVIIQHPEKNYVKRIIGLPKEKIEVKNNVLFINDVKQPTLFVDEQHSLFTGNLDPIEIPAKKYFVMGDYRAISKDSRNGLGLIDEADIIGRSEFVIYPIHEWEITR